MTIEEILNSTELTAAQKVAALKEKSINVPVWGGRYGLVRQYDPNKHPVMDKSKYPDVVRKTGKIDITILFTAIDHVPGSILT